MSYDKIQMNIDYGSLTYAGNKPWQAYNHGVEMLEKGLLSQKEVEQLFRNYTNSILAAMHHETSTPNVNSSAT